MGVCVTTNKKAFYLMHNSIKVEYTFIWHVNTHTHVQALDMIQDLSFFFPFHNFLHHVGYKISATPPVALYWLCMAFHRASKLGFSEQFYKCVGIILYILSKLGLGLRI